MDILIKNTFPNEAGILVSFKRPLTMDSTRKSMMQHLKEKYKGTVQFISNVFAFVTPIEEDIDSDEHINKID